ncbi:MAG: DUF1622 domain-containing protein [Bacteroidia bacterium]
MNDIKLYISYAARVIEVIGVLTLVVGVLIAFVRFAFLNGDRMERYTSLRQELGKGILLGLEILVAGDIIATVVTEPTMNRVLTLAVIVLIRTFLSLSIEVEIKGKFPWQNLIK